MPQADAMSRLASWLDTPELEPPRKVRLSDAVALACDEKGHWRGSALYVYNNDCWTVFEDLSGYFSSVPADSWLAFAQSDDFVFAGYNDAIEYGELIVIERAAVVREFLFDAENPEVNVNRGQIVGNPIEPIETWIQVARFVDDDDVAFSEQGWLWIHAMSA